MTTYALIIATLLNCGQPVVVYFKTKMACELVVAGLSKADAKGATCVPYQAVEPAQTHG